MQMLQHAVRYANAPTCCTICKCLQHAVRYANAFNMLYNMQMLQHAVRYANAFSRHRKCIPRPRNTKSMICSAACLALDNHTKRAWA
ncbi:hypothetical protein DUNSADRAFT_14183 [Dunaliella salina]|uniref:Encoded protein n=1 Tax=Dunaliella salina TaxID=3046 RepID=A0ABQ7G7W8_DUNSA|nr:hypothetical protein DUNSADRAFT_14183 [Dunaliella salina]|eukprot:KAF5830697.1 hypothetical protein DUNSADRAFT_14183 [Dunaliella salina]